jgi:hypothetical protein
MYNNAHNNDRFFELVQDDGPPSEAMPPPPKTQKTQASLLVMFGTPKAETVTQNQKHEVPLAVRGVLVG